MNNPLSNDPNPAPEKTPAAPESAQLSIKLKWIIWLLSANVAVMTVACLALVFGLLPKVERSLQTLTRVEGRFHAFADEVQPVVTASAGKAVETIRKIDADRLSKTATERSDELIDTAAD